MLRVGLVGVPRGYALLPAFLAQPGVEVVAVCDRMQEAAAWLAGQCAASPFADYESMLEAAGVDAVFIGTPMPLHASMSIAALDRGVHVLSEVPAAVSVDECRALVRAAARSSAIYMLGENYCFSRTNAIVGELARAGAFGEIYFAVGEYLHEYKVEGERTPWRRRWQTGIDGCTYGTHSLGPLLQWLESRRVAAVSCIGTGHHYLDARGEAYEQQDSVLMACRLTGGGLAQVRVDMLSERPPATTNYALQGTAGAYESARAFGERDRVWLRGRSSDPHAWDALADYEDEFCPRWWSDAPAGARESDHGGGDWAEAAAFVAAVRGEAPCPIDVHRALDMTLPGLVSQQSILEGGRWMDVPDPRAW
jgi:predicted dehydrogenase